jgi:hypothetical protein
VRVGYNPSMEFSECISQATIAHERLEIASRPPSHRRATAYSSHSASCGLAHDIAETRLGSHQRALLLHVVDPELGALGRSTVLDR